MTVGEFWSALDYAAEAARDPDVATPAELDELAEIQRQEQEERARGGS